VLHDEDLAQAIIDRVLERGRLIRLDGPSIRTLHVNLDDTLNEGSDQDVDLARISGITTPEFPEPTCATSFGIAFATAGFREALATRKRVLARDILGDIGLSKAAKVGKGAKADANGGKTATVWCSSC